MNRFMQPLVAPARQIQAFALPKAVQRTLRPLCVWLACCCCLLLAACLEARLPDGVVATVNGEPITLRRLQTLLDSRSPSLGAMRKPSLENMRREYGEGLGTLIIYALVRQDLQRLQMTVSPATRPAGAVSKSGAMSLATLITAAASDFSSQLSNASDIFCSRRIFSTIG